MVNVLAGALKGKRGELDPVTDSLMDGGEA